MEKFIFKARNGCDAWCGLDVRLKPEGPTVVLTELGDNPGPSITNAYEEIATVLVTDVWLGNLGNPENIRWVEHYDQHSYEHFSKPEPERFTLVSMTWDGRRYTRARFSPLQPDEV